MKKITSYTNSAALKNMELILQHGAGYTDATDSKTTLLTIHIGNNVIITGWNNITKMTILLHIDTVMQLSSVQDIIEKLEENSCYNKINNDDNNKDKKKNNDEKKVKQKLFINIIYADTENVSLGNPLELAPKKIIKDLINIIKGGSSAANCNNINIINNTNNINESEKLNTSNKLNYSDYSELDIEPKADTFLTLKKINPNNALGINAKTGKLIIIPESKLELSNECLSEYLYAINERKSKEIYLQQFKQLTKLELELLIEALPFEQFTSVSQSYYPIIMDYEGDKNNKSTNNIINS